MLRSRALNKKINHIHKRALRTVYSDYNLTFYELLDKDDTFKIYQNNVQILAIEIYKYLHGLYPAILRDIFKVNETIPYDLRMLSNMKHQSRLKVLQKLYIINNVIFRPHWFKPFSN